MGCSKVENITYPGRKKNGKVVVLYENSAGTESKALQALLETEKSPPCTCWFLWDFVTAPNQEWQRSAAHQNVVAVDANGETTSACKLCVCSSMQRERVLIATERNSGLFSAIFHLSTEKAPLNSNNSALGTLQKAFCMYHHEKDGNGLS